VTPLSLQEFLSREEALAGSDPVLTRLLVGISEACKEISAKVREGALAGVLGLAGSENVQGEEQKKLDIISNDIFVEAVARTGAVCGMVSEEVPEPIAVPEELPLGPYLACFDPLDGSSNIDINVSIGSIFAILPAERPKRVPAPQDFLQPGRNLTAAGYCMYGPQTILALTLGRGVFLFTLDDVTGTFRLTKENVRVPREAKEFAINMSNQRFWEAPVVRYVSELLQGKDGPRGKNYNMRWVAAMVAEVHRILMRGGIFMYPRDSRNPERAGKLRLLYEANPMSMLMENAGGASTNGHERIRDIVPNSIHERVAVFLGAAEEVETVTGYHKA